MWCCCSCRRRRRRTKKLKFGLTMGFKRRLNRPNRTQTEPKEAPKGPQRGPKRIPKGASKASCPSEYPNILGRILPIFLEGYSQYPWKDTLRIPGRILFVMWRIGRGHSGRRRSRGLQGGTAAGVGQGGCKEAQPLKVFGAVSRVGLAGRGWGFYCLSAVLSLILTFGV